MSSAQHRWASGLGSSVRLVRGSSCSYRPFANLVRPSVVDFSSFRPVVPPSPRPFSTALSSSRPTAAHCFHCSTATAARALGDILNHHCYDPATKLKPCCAPPQWGSVASFLEPPQHFLGATVTPLQHSRVERSNSSGRAVRHAPWQDQMAAPWRDPLAATTGIRPPFRLERYQGHS